MIYDIVHGDRLGAAVLHPDLQMVLQIGAHPWHVDEDFNTEIAQDLGRSQTGKLQQLRRVECAAGDDHFGVGVSSAGDTLLKIANAHGAAS